MDFKGFYRKHEETSPNVFVSFVSSFVHCFVQKFFGITLVVKLLAGCFWLGQDIGSQAQCVRTASLVKLLAGWLAVAPITDRFPDFPIARGGDLVSEPHSVELIGWRRKPYGSCAWTPNFFLSEP